MERRLAGSPRDRHVRRRHGREKPARDCALRAVNILLALIQLRLAVQHGKKIAELADRLGGAQEEKAVRVQRVVEQGNELLLQVSAHIDQEVAAADEVEPGEGRILDHVLLGKDQHVADALVDAVGAAAGLGREEARQPLRRDVGGDAGRIEAGPGRGNGLAVDVGGEDLHLEILFQRLQALLRAGWRWNRPPRRWSSPAPRRGSVESARLAGKELRDDLLLERLEGLRVTEKTGHADQEVAKERFHLLRLSAADI